MLAFIVRRIIYMIPTLIAISIVAFIVIQLPPGDFLSSYIASLESSGQNVDAAQIAALQRQYGLDASLPVQYWKWISGIVLRGDFGQSFEWKLPVSVLIWDRLGLTFVLSLATLIFVWVLAFPIGLYSAVRKYSIGDYTFTLLGFIGLATPSFLVALLLAYLGFKWFGVSVSGLFSPEYEGAPWSWGKVLDLLAHLWVPMIVLGLSGTAAVIRTMRANLLDELSRPYVTTARAKGMSEGRLLMKYPVRLALNPVVSSLGHELVNLVSGSTIVAIVLSLPTTGPLLLRALQAQDMYLAGSFILMMSLIAVIGTLLSDVLLAWLDPRIRYS